MTVPTRCPYCGATGEVKCSVEGFMAWQRGTAIQKALPELSRDQREQLKTGICAACWSTMLKEEDA